MRPTQMNFVPRIWDMLYQEYVSEVDRPLGPTADVEQVMAELREKLLGHVTSAPSPVPPRSRPS